MGTHWACPRRRRCRLHGRRKQRLRTFSMPVEVLRKTSGSPDQQREHPRRIGIKRSQDVQLCACRQNAALCLQRRATSSLRFVYYDRANQVIAGVSSGDRCVPLLRVDTQFRNPVTRFRGIELAHRVPASKAPRPPSTPHRSQRTVAGAGGFRFARSRRFQAKPADP